MRQTFAKEKMAFMLTDFRNWLESELKLLGNASHHAYSFGQANMAKRALERFDAETAGRIVIGLTVAEAEGASTALETLAESTPALAVLRERLRTASSASAAG